MSGCLGTGLKEGYIINQYAFMSSYPWPEMSPSHLSKQSLEFNSTFVISDSVLWSPSLTANLKITDFGRHFCPSTVGEKRRNFSAIQGRKVFYF